MLSGPQGQQQPLLALLNLPGAFPTHGGAHFSPAPLNPSWQRCLAWVPHPLGSRQPSLLPDRYEDLQNKLVLLLLNEMTPVISPKMLQLQDFQYCIKGKPDERDVTIVTSYLKQVCSWHS